MKKTLIIVLTGLLLIGCGSSGKRDMRKEYESVGAAFVSEVDLAKTASPTPTPTLEPKVYSRTHPRNAFEFCELYSSRLAEFATGSTTNIIYGSDYAMFDQYDVHLDDNSYIVSVSAGMIGIDKDSLCISTGMFTINSNGEETLNSPGDSKLFRCMAVFSALEYDAHEDAEIWRRYSKGDEEAPSAYLKAMKVWTNEIIPNLKSVYESAKAESKLVPIYSGNYDYYVRYSESSDSFILWVEAV